MKLRLRTKVLLSEGLVILIVLVTSTLVHLRDVRRDYLESVELRGEALAQSLLYFFEHSQKPLIAKLQEQKVDVDIRRMLKQLNVQCTRFYELNRDKNVTHFAIIDDANTIAAHNDQQQEEQQITSATLLSALKQHQQITVLDEAIYHTFLPIYLDDTYIGTIDVGIEKAFIDQKIGRFLIDSGILLLLFLVMAIFTVSLSVHLTMTKPINALVNFGQQLAEGKLVQMAQISEKGDEISILETAFIRIGRYFKEMVEVASHIAIGALDQDMKIRSEYDILGKTFHNMVVYLRDVSSVATKIAEGDLTRNIQIRSNDDTFGRAIQTMLEGLRTLIVRIRSSSEQISSTGKNISSLAAQDISIVQNVNTSAEQMMSTMREIGAIIDEVAQNMDTLSSSVSETTTSVSQVAASIRYIASNTNELTKQTHETIASLNETVQSLEGVVQSTDVSKQLSQDTIQDALEGQQSVEQVMSSMDLLQRTITMAVEAINRFAARSQDIDTILEVIRGIADQTQLLALNASIIAAQAGVHGRGFAVVADEIKTLAGGVTSSTTDIAAIVKSLQEDTNEVVQVIHQGSENVAQSVKRTQHARETLQKIITSAQRSSAVVTEIADALHELMTTSHNVTAAMEQVNTMTDEITTATNEQQESTAQINKTIAHINEMASHIQKATGLQSKGIQQILVATQDVTKLMKQNLDSSQSIVDTTKELTSQAEFLLHSVDRFKLSQKEKR